MALKERRIAMTDEKRELLAEALRSYLHEASRDPKASEYYRSALAGDTDSLLLYLGSTGGFDPADNSIREFERTSCLELLEQFRAQGKIPSQESNA
jgi:hypothetical protein